MKEDLKEELMFLASEMAVFCFLILLGSTFVMGQIYENPNLPHVPRPSQSSSGGGGSGSSVAAGDNCILVSPTTGDVFVSFNESCGSNLTLPGNLAYLNETQIFTGENTFATEDVFIENYLRFSDGTTSEKGLLINEDCFFVESHSTGLWDFGCLGGTGIELSISGFDDGVSIFSETTISENFTAQNIKTSNNLWCNATSCFTTADFLATGGGGGNPFDQSLNTTDNVTFHNVTATGWFKGLFNWTVTSLSNYLSASFDGNNLTIDFNESKLNQTIDARQYNVTNGLNPINVTQINATQLLINGQEVCIDSTTTASCGNKMRYEEHFLTFRSGIGFDDLWTITGAVAQAPNCADGVAEYQHHGIASCLSGSTAGVTPRVFRKGPDAIYIGNQSEQCITTQFKVVNATPTNGTGSIMEYNVQMGLGDNENPTDGIYWQWNVTQSGATNLTLVTANGGSSSQQVTQTAITDNTWYQATACIFDAGFTQFVVGIVAGDPTSYLSFSNIPIDKTTSIFFVNRVDSQVGMAGTELFRMDLIKYSAPQEEIEVVTAI